MGVHGVEYAFDYALIVPLLGAALLWSFGLLAWWRKMRAAREFRGLLFLFPSKEDDFDPDFIGPAPRSCLSRRPFFFIHFLGNQLEECRTLNRTTIRAGTAAEAATGAGRSAR